MAAKKISPAAIVALREALTNIYWYKGELRAFLHAAVPVPHVLARLNWDGYKRDTVRALVDILEQVAYQQELLALMAEVAAIYDFSHLEKLEDGRAKADKARASVLALKRYCAGHAALAEEGRKIAERRERAADKQRQACTLQAQVEALKQAYLAMFVSAQPQKRGYALEKLLNQLFELVDLEPRNSFKVNGEQIDGAFVHEKTPYLLEAKWQDEPVGAADLYVFSSKVAGKLDNTLGLFIAISGFSEPGVAAYAASGQRRALLLMDGADLMAVLEGRIELPQLLRRKHGEASQTGNVYIRIHEVLGG